MAIYPGARQLPTHHITIRVPWHDSGWNGTVCKNVCANTSCTALSRIALKRDDEFESKREQKPFAELTEDELPPCIEERVSFMSDTALTLSKSHPYTYKNSHAHFDETLYTIRPYSAAAVPFKWMLRKFAEKKSTSLKLNYHAEKEDDIQRVLEFDHSSWVQHGHNQRVLLDTFFGAVKPEESLVFFYAKKTPLTEDPSRVIVGVGRVKRVDPEPTEYKYKNGRRPDDGISGFLWERNVEHSIGREQFDGFLLPYQTIVELAENDPALNPADYAALAPSDYFNSFSYGSELLSDDGAIASLLSVERVVRKLGDVLDGPWDECLSWIDSELNRLWQLRGLYPGFGAALHAFGIENGNLLAWDLVTNAEGDEDPWALLDNCLKTPGKLPQLLQYGISSSFRDKWIKLPDERRALLKLLSSFSLSNEQATKWYHRSERLKDSIHCLDNELLGNPYLLYEEDRTDIEGIGFEIIDRGAFPRLDAFEDAIESCISDINEPIDKRRVRALVLNHLEQAALLGHTYLPEDWLVNQVRDRTLKPKCPLDPDTLASQDSFLAEKVNVFESEKEQYGYQLQRLAGCADLIKKTVAKRHNGLKHEGDFDWRPAVDKAIDFDQKPQSISTIDEQARQEKAAALEVIYRNRISVLTGGAGTGKSTLLKALVNLEAIKSKRILLLAPTGKARVRLEETTGLKGRGKTIAQFLHKRQRYAGFNYFINNKAEKDSSYKTVIIDECSMLTEEQLAATFDALHGVDRYVLVGDYNQLPPIGPGRPYFDIINYLKPENIEYETIKVKGNYAELTTTMRQARTDDENDLLDVKFANLFTHSGADIDLDDIWTSIIGGKSDRIKMVEWKHPSDLPDLLITQIVRELGLESNNDETGFEASLGANISDKNGRKISFFNNRYNGNPGAAENCENWQILSPVRQGQIGVVSINRLIQQKFRSYFIKRAKIHGQKKYTPPLGPESIIYGDKVINIRNENSRRTYPERQGAYLANGDIGVVVGHRKTKNKCWNPKELEVEYSSQPGHVFKYWFSEFSEEGPLSLELAYALTVHKTQGSEFGTTFLVLPNPCRILSRELIYTAITRQVNKLIILHQGNALDTQPYTNHTRSEVLGRMTNLFQTSIPVNITYKNKNVILDQNLIYKTLRGDHLVRSKSEWLIADHLFNNKIHYQYEQPLELQGITRYPDFTVFDDDSGFTWYWEHNGMMSKPSYRNCWEKKLQAYKSSGILPLTEGGGPNGILLTTEECEGVGLKIEDIQRNIAAINGEVSF